MFILQRIIELFFHWHRWGEWELDGGFTIQKRTCQICGLTRWKS